MMGEQILTQVEVDALLKGLTNGDIRTEAEKAGDVAGEVRPYDFRNQERAVRGRMPTLEMINEKFSRSARGPLFNIIRKAVDINTEGIKAMRYEEFLNNLQVPSALNLFQLMPLRGQGLLVLEPSLVFTIVDSYFGGDGRFHTRVEGRDFTNVEQAVVKKIVEVIFSEMKETWKPVFKVDFNHVRAEMNPQFVNLTSGNEPVIVSSFKMDIEAQSSRFHFCVPFATYEPIKDKLFGNFKVDSNEVDRKWSTSLREQFSFVPIGVSSDVGSAHISVAELLNLRVGDVIQLDRKAREPLEMEVEGHAMFRVRPGVMDNNYALEVIDVIKERG